MQTLKVMCTCSHSLIHSILFVSLAQAITRDHHHCLSFTFLLSSPQLTLLACISFSTADCQVSFHRPLTLFPRGVQCMATLGIADGSILRTWPIQRHLLFFTSELMFLVEVVRCRSVFEMVLSQKMFRMQRKQ